MADFADYYREIYARGLGGETPAIPVSVAELERRAAEAMDDAGRQLRLRRRRQRGHDARQPRGLPAPADRAADAARRRQPRPLDHGARARRCRRRCCWRRSASRRSSTRTASWPPRAPRRRSALPMIASTASHFTLEEIAEAGGDGAALVPALLAQRPRARRQLRRPRRGGRLRRDRRHRRHLHPRLEAARPAAGLAALPRRHGHRQLLPGPGLPRRPRADAGGGRRRRHRPLPRRPRQPRADLGRPRLAARADLAADPRQGHPARRRRPRGGARAASTASSSPTTAAARSTARSPRSTRCRRSPTRSATSSRSSSTAASAAAPTCSRRSRSAPTRSASAAPTSGAWRWTARPGVETVLKMVLAELDLTMALCGLTRPDQLGPDASPRP